MDTINNVKERINLLEIYKRNSNGKLDKENQFLLDILKEWLLIKGIAY